MQEKKPHKNEVLEELESLSPLLGKFKAQEKRVSKAEDIPPRYFEELSEVLWNRVQAEQSLSVTRIAKPKVNWLDLLAKQLQSLFTPQLVIGFSVVLLGLVAWFGFLKPNQQVPLLADQQSIPGIQELPEEDLYNYVMTHIDDYDTEDLLEIAGPLPIELAWPEIEDETQVDKVIDELLEALVNADFL